LTIQSIIDIWKFISEEAKIGARESTEMKGGDYRIRVMHCFIYFFRIAFPIEGGDYEGVQSFS
jgi:hypothetical protein